MLLGLDGERAVADRETLFFSARVFVESLAMSGPTLLLFEDIHWADTSLLDLLETLASRVRDVPVFFVALARPELLTDRPTGAAGSPRTRRYRWSRSRRTRAESSPSSSSRSPTSRRARSAVAETAEGNPLFIEELAASIAEKSTAGAAPDERSGAHRGATRLTPAGRAQRAGRRVRRGTSLLARRTHQDRRRDDLTDLLGSLEARDLIRREAVSRIRGDQQFGFKHGLIHDVAYQRLPRAGRRERHAAVAGFLEEATGEMGQSNEALAPSLARGRRAPTARSTA